MLLNLSSAAEDSSNSATIHRLIGETRLSLARCNGSVFPGLNRAPSVVLSSTNRYSRGLSNSLTIDIGDRFSTGGSFMTAGHLLAMQFIGSSATNG